MCKLVLMQMKISKGLESTNLHVGWNLQLLNVPVRSSMSRFDTSEMKVFMLTNWHQERKLWPRRRWSHSSVWNLGMMVYFPAFSSVHDLKRLSFPPTETETTHQPPLAGNPVIQRSWWIYSVFESCSFSPAGLLFAVNLWEPACLCYKYILLQLR